MKTIVISIFIAMILIVGAIVSTSGISTQSNNIDNVSIIDGKQVISINVRGGYQPRKSIAKANIPSMIRFNTNGTFDCSISVRIPSIGFSKILPQTGSTGIDIGTQNPGLLKGSCGMGMYNFEIEFKK